MAILALLVVACGVSQATAPVPSATPVPPTTAAPTATPEPTSTATPSPTPTPTATPKPEPRPKRPTPEVRFSEVASVAPPRSEAGPTAVPGGTELPVPEGTRVAWGGCASDGKCLSHNFYWAPTREAVLQHGEPPHKVQHELCHAHQHWSINRGAPLAPSDYDLEPWYGTLEGRSYMGAIAGLPWAWSHSEVNGIEDFAWTCAYWYVDPGHLYEVSRARYYWAQANLP